MPLYSLNGRRPTLPPDGFFWIAPNASVIGDVVVGLDVGIWFGAVLRGDNEPINIGARTNIQESCTLHTDMGFPLSIGEECTVGHNAILHGCAIGDGSLIGMGAIVLNGARIVLSSWGRLPKRSVRWTRRRRRSCVSPPRTMSRIGAGLPWG
jgi:carbonic anhydrase/acetyltransferase-like protein (isoleucine patch superfamily)